MSARPRLLIAFALTLLCVALLSISLVGVELRPGTPRPSTVQLPEPAGAATTQGPGIVLILFRILLILGIALTVVYVIISLFSAEGRKRLLAASAVLLVVLLALILLSRVRLPQQAREVQPEPSSAGQALDAASSPAPPPIPFEPQPPRWLLWAALATIAALAVGGAVGIALLLSRRRSSSLRERLAAETGAAVEALQAGGDLRDVVMRCYQQMTLIAREEMGIQRQSTVTPREFQHVLETSGLPPEPVRDLTRAFEEIRYGHAAPSPRVEQLAVRSLERIAQYCRGSR